MKPNQIRIKSDGTSKGTTIESYVGDTIKDVLALNISINGGHRAAEVELKLVGSEIDIIADCTNIEDLAKELHEAGRAAVEQGNTVAAEKFGEQTRKFIEWDELTEPAKDGRRIQAVYLLKKYYIREKRHE